MKVLVGQPFNQEKALVGAFSVIVKPVVEPMEHYTALVPSLAPPGEARHHLLELPGILLRQLRHHLADLVLDARVARRRAPPRQHLRRQYCNRNIFSNMTNIFVSILLFVDIYTYF